MNWSGSFAFHCDHALDRGPDHVLDPVRLRAYRQGYGDDPANVHHYHAAIVAVHVPKTDHVYCYRYYQTIWTDDSDPRAVNDDGLPLVLLPALCVFPFHA